MGHARVAILLHKFVLVEVKIVFSLVLKLLTGHADLIVVAFVLIDSFFENFLSGRPFVNFGVATHFDLNIFPFRCDATCHMIFLILI